MINIKKYNCYYNNKEDKYYLDKSYPQKKSKDYCKQKKDSKTNVDHHLNIPYSQPRILNCVVYYVGEAAAKLEVPNFQLQGARNFWGQHGIEIYISNSSSSGLITDSTLTSIFGNPEAAAGFNFPCGTALNPGANRNAEFETLANKYSFWDIVNIYYLDFYRLDLLKDQKSEGPWTIGCCRNRYSISSDGTIRTRADIYIPIQPTPPAGFFPGAPHYEGNTENQYTLAHEIGHALFFRQINGNWSDANPSVNNQYGAAHDKRTNNLMNPSVPSKSPTLDQIQISTAQNSRLLRSTPILIQTNDD
ncbi:hypothetical protein [Priestia megaterium]|uniref:hypothetical protein n=1 Tax=Priestia megaterium TaxID=1404 RepID=UPI001CD248C7|nr:hypothetical protein [Priestia megaterium]